MAYEVKRVLDLTNIDILVKTYQHWITLVGGLATLAALLVTYSRMKKRVERFRSQASTEVTIADLANTIAAVEDLLGRKTTNKALLQWKMMRLRKLLANIRPDLFLDRLDLTDQFQALITRATLFEGQITRYVHTQQKNIDSKGFYAFLLELKNLLLRINNSIGIMSKDGKHDTK